MLQPKHLHKSLSAAISTKQRKNNIMAAPKKPLITTAPVENHIAWYTHLKNVAAADSPANNQTADNTLRRPRAPLPHQQDSAILNPPTPTSSPPTAQSVITNNALSRPATSRSQPADQGNSSRESFDSSASSTSVTEHRNINSTAIQ